MKSTLRIISPAEPGKSFSSERKRVRVHLLKHYQPFVDELHDLVATLESYSNGVGKELLESTKTRWQVLIDVVPESELKSAKEPTGI
ncbi:MAG: hypothetical protein R2827_13415, partial [Bdellovibrionales bacterium]